MNSNKYILSTAVSKFGNILFDYTNSILLVSSNNASKLVAIYNSSQVLVSLVFNLFGGIISDQVSKKKVLVYSNLLLGALCFLCYIFLKTQYLYIVIIICNILISVVYSFTRPSTKAIIPLLVKKEDIANFNARYQIIMEFIRVLSPVIAATIVVCTSPQIGILVNGITFFLSAIIIHTISYEERISKKIDFSAQHLKQSIDYLISKKEILYLVLFVSIVNFFLSGYNIILPFQSNVHIIRGYSLFEVMLAFEAIGGIMGGIIYSKIAKKELINKICIYPILTGTSLVILSITKNEGIFILSLMLHAISGSIFNILFYIKIQTRVDKQHMGRVFSIIYTCIMIGVPLGNFTFGWVLEYNKLADLYFNGICIIMISLLYLILMLKSSVGSEMH